MGSLKRPNREALESQDAKRAKHGIVDSKRNHHDARAAAILEGAQMTEWLSKEDDFVLKQAKKRAAIRVRESRAKPIDFLAVNLRFVDAERDPAEENELEEVEIKPKNPRAYLKSLHPQELKELEGDVDEFYKLETNRSNKRYWKALLTVCKAMRSSAKARTTTESRTSDTVGCEIEKILSGKTANQLETLEKSILKKLDGTQAIDVDYWEHLYKAVKEKLAWASLDNMFGLITDAAEEESRRKQVIFEDGKRQTVDGPKRYQLEVAAQQTLTVRSTEKEFESAAARLYKQEASHQLEADEDLFNVEAEVAKRSPKWKAKYPNIEPIKPKYFNRVQTGFEWNSYNRTHYNDENPPPRIVRGYRFNVFYPDLMDNTRAPNYKIERLEGPKSNPAALEDMVIIRFSAGPPYADVCFEIVDKDWDHSSRFDRGFKSSFDKGILQLHFKFKRVSYRK